MSRFQTKCLLASVAFHASLLGVVLLGSAFVSRRAAPEEIVPLLTLVPAVRDDETTGGGNPEAVALPVPNPAPAVEPPKPAPPPQAEPAAPVEPKFTEPAPQKTPEPAPRPPKPVKPTTVAEDFKDLFEKEPVPTPKADFVKPSKPDRNSKPKETKETRPSPTPLSPDKPRERRKVEVDLTETKVGNPTAAQARREREKAARAAQAKAAADAAARYQQWAQNRNSALTVAVAGLANSMAPSTVVEMPGPGGEFYASYRQFVYTVYTQAWQPPADLEDDSATVEAEVVIARDGHVVSSAITSKSANAAMNKSIQKTLERVRFVHAFPEGAKDSERTFKIRFNLRAKRQTG